MAKRRLVQRLAPEVVERYGPVTDRDEWLRRTSERLRATQAEALADLVEADVSVEVMVSAIEPLTEQPAASSSSSTPWPSFEWVLDDDGFAVERAVSA